MKEPQVQDQYGNYNYFSAAPAWSLLHVVAQTSVPAPSDDNGEMPDMDFHARYAAILLRERGL